MQDAERAAALVRFLLLRQPLAAEQAEFETPGFDCDAFLIRLLCSAEGAERYADPAEEFIEFLRKELSRATQSHKLAHDLGLAKDDLHRLQGKIDGLNGSLVELLRQEDRIGGVFDQLRGLQAEFLALSQRVGRIESRLMVTEGAGGGY